MILTAALVQQRKGLVLILVRQMKNFTWVWFAFCLLTEKKSISLKLIIKKHNFQTQFRLGRISNKFDTVEFREVSFKGNVYYFSVDYNAINKFDISNISKFLMVKSTIKQCYRLLNKCLLHYWVSEEIFSS